MELTEFELLSNESIYIEGIGNFKIPTLKDIRKIGYKTYETMANYLSIDLKKYLELTDLTERYSELDEESKQKNTLYKFIINTDEFLHIYCIIFSFFISENFRFNQKNNSFEFYKTDIHKEIKKIENKNIFKRFFNLFKKNTEEIVETIKEETIIGSINDENFDLVRDILLQINKIKVIEKPVEELKFKNENAKKLYERMQKNKEASEAKEKNDFNLGKMISKYCADNKNGINILNIWNMTYLQFLDQFSQHNYIRQTNVQDMIYANTVSFSDLKAYDSQAWLK